MQGCVSPTCDDLGRPVALPRTVRRVVSLVPSLTKAEKRAADLDALRAAGVAVWVTARPFLVETHDVLRRQLDV